MVLSAGYGSRLRPLTDEIPKPLLPVGDRPLLVSILEGLHEEGAFSVSVNAHHRSDDIVNVIRRLPFEVHVSLEGEILGTAGGVSAVKARIQRWPLLLHNGDILVRVPVKELLAGSTPWMRLLVAPRSDAAGTVGLGAQGEVVRLRGERFGEETHSADYAGVCTLSARAADRLPAVGCLIGDLALPLLRAGETIGTALVPEGFTDVGSLRSFVDCNMAWLRSHDLTEWVAEGTQLGRNVQVQQSLVGAGCVVTGEGSLERCVLLPGARAAAPMKNSVVTPSGRVVPVD